MVVSLVWTLLHCLHCHPQVWSFSNSCQVQLFLKLLLTQSRESNWGVQIALSWSFRMTRPNGHNGIVTCSAKISRCTSTAWISPAASHKLTGLAALESKRAVWGRMTCDSPLSAIAIGFMSLTGTKILADVRNTLLPHASGVTLE